MNSKELQEAYGHTKERPQTSYERVREFHETFGHPVADSPSAIMDERYTLRLALILEEATELAEAMGFHTPYFKKATEAMLNNGRLHMSDIVAIADALGDLEYVTNGAALEMGIPLPEVVEEIHRSNMTKLGPDGKPIYRKDGKILKGEGYEPPQLEKVLWSE